MIQGKRSIFLTMIILISCSIMFSGCLNKSDGSNSNNPEDHLKVTTPRSVRAEGYIGNSGNIEQIFFYINMIGQTGIDMRNILVYVLSTPNGGNISNATFSLNDDSVSSYDTDHYGVEVLHDPGNYWDPASSPPSYMLNEGTLLKLTIDINSTTGSLPPDSMIRYEMISTISGQKTIDEWTTPPVYSYTGTILKLES